MAAFTYVARDGRGNRQRGKAEAASPQELSQQLRRQGLLVVKLEVIKPSDAKRWYDPREWLPATSFDVELGLRQLAVMLRSGLSLLQSLQTAADQSRRPAMRRIWEDLGRRIEAGSSLADAMRVHKCFNRLLLQLVTIGEQTGILDIVLERGADHLEARRQLRTQIITALAYPAIVLVAAVGVTGFMVFGVIPEIQKFLVNLGRKLPPMTQMLVDISNFAVTYVWWIALGLLVLTGLMAAIYSLPRGRLEVDRRLLRVPVIGKIQRMAATAEFSRGLGLLIRSGITLVEGLRSVEQLHRNHYLAGRVRNARYRVMEGEGLAHLLQQPGTYMPMLSRMVAVGESAGTLDDMLDEVADFHEKQLAVLIRQLATIVEPVIIVLVGGIVGFVYISFFLALFAAAGGS